LARVRQQLPAIERRRRIRDRYFAAGSNDTAAAPATCWQSDATFFQLSQAGRVAYLVHTVEGIGVAMFLEKGN
jgi:hypothetical protein